MILSSIHCYKHIHIGRAFWDIGGGRSTWLTVAEYATGNIKDINGYFIVSQTPSLPTEDNGHFVCIASIPAANNMAKQEARARSVMELTLSSWSRAVSVHKGLPSSTVITRSNITWYCTHQCRNWGRISIRDWTRKRQASYVLSFVSILKKIDHVITASRCIYHIATLTKCPKFCRSIQT